MEIYSPVKIIHDSGKWGSVKWSIQQNLHLTLSIRHLLYLNVKTRMIETRKDHLFLSGNIHLDYSKIFRWVVLYWASSYNATKPTYIYDLFKKITFWFALDMYSATRTNVNRLWPWSQDYQCLNPNSATNWPQAPTLNSCLMFKLGMCLL